MFRRDSPRPAERAWQPFLDRVSLAGVAMVLSEWVLAVADFTGNRELDDETIELLETRFRRLPLPDYPLWVVPDGPPVRWYEGHGAILRADSGTWVWVRSGSSDGITAVRRALPGEWLMQEESRGAQG